MAQTPPPQPINQPPSVQDDDADNNEMEMLMQSLSQKVKAHPYYAMCALHISAWREFHTVLKEEFKERVTLLDERYLRLPATLISSKSPSSFCPPYQPSSKQVAA